MRDLQDNEAVGLMRFKELSRHPIKNALTEKNMPLSDMYHGPSAMMPPEVMHVLMAGMLKYMFQSMSWYIGETKLRDEIDKMHVRMLLDVKRQSDRDFPRGSMRNGIIDDTKCQAEERKCNLFLLLCIGSTSLGCEKLKTALQYEDRMWKKWLEFIKLYLSMEQWFHDSNPKEEVKNARQLINTQGPVSQRRDRKRIQHSKISCMTKMVFYIQRYGSALTFTEVQENRHTSSLLRCLD